MAKAGQESTVAEMRSQLHGEVAETSTKRMVVAHALEAEKPKLRINSVGRSVDRH